MRFLSKLLNKCSIGRKLLARKESSELRSLEARYEEVRWELAELGNEISRRKGFMRREGEQK